MSSSTTSSFQLAPRPGVCTRGPVLEVFANTFEIRSFPKVPFFHYDVVIESDRPNPKIASRVIHRLQHHTAPSIFSQTAAVFDGAKNLYSIGRPLFPEGAMTFNVNMSDDPPQGPSSRGLFTVTLTKVAVISPSDLMRVLEGHGAGIPITTTPLQVLNVLVQQAAAVNFPVHKRQRYYIRDGHDSFLGFEIWRGFFAAIRPTPGKLLLNVDMVTGVLFQRGSLIDFLLTHFNLRDPRMLNDLNEEHREWHQVNSLLKGVQIQAGPKGLTRTIHKIQAKAGAVDFPLDNGPTTTVEDYYRDKYAYNLKYPLMPGIRTRKEEVIPFELCKIKEGQFLKKKAPPELTSRMLSFAKKRPSERLDIVRRGMTGMQIGDSPHIMQAGLVLSAQPMEIQGRILDPPPMVYGSKMIEKPRAGAWNMVNKQLIEPKAIRTWAVVCFESTVTQEAIMHFILGLRNAMSAVGMSVATPPSIDIVAPYQINKELSRVCSETVKRTKDIPSLIIVILPQSAAAVRKEVKQFGDVLEGIVTQCVRVDKMRKANNQYHNNLILKINAKLGGTNTVPSQDSPSFRWFLDGKTMVVGADVTHPGPNVLRPSVAALVASIDEGAAKYISHCAVQGPRTEIIEDLKGLMSYALKMFSKYRGHLAKTLNRKDIPILPERIVFYRDGVSEGEIHQVAESEIRQVMDAVELIYAGMHCPFRAKLTFIVVGKRHHIRFIPKQGRGEDRSGNAPAGLLVDQGITAPGIFDFYLLSHAGLLGTSRPSHYIVVKDDNNFDANTLQGFSFDLCHTYARATRSVSIPAPCYYADIACARADYHFNPNLNYEDDASSSGGFDLDSWVKGFRNVHPRQATNMYFM